MLSMSYALKKHCLPASWLSKRLRYILACLGIWVYYEKKFVGGQTNFFLQRNFIQLMLMSLVSCCNTDSLMSPEFIHVVCTASFFKKFYLFKRKSYSFIYGSGKRQIFCYFILQMAAMARAEPHWLLVLMSTEFKKLAQPLAFDAVPYQCKSLIQHDMCSILVSVPSCELGFAWSCLVRALLVAARPTPHPILGYTFGCSCLDLHRLLSVPLPPSSLLTQPITPQFVS